MGRSYRLFIAADSCFCAPELTIALGQEPFCPYPARSFRQCFPPRALASQFILIHYKGSPSIWVQAKKKAAQNLNSLEKLPKTNG